MNTRQKEQQHDKSGAGKPDDEQTFETDISETGDDGTTVRQAEVRKDDLSETNPPAEKKSSQD